MYVLAMYILSPYHPVVLCGLMLYSPVTAWCADRRCAVLDSEKAWRGLQGIPSASFGVGSSKANALFWAASRVPSALPAKAPPAAVVVEAQCSLNSACDAAGQCTQFADKQCNFV